MRLKSRYKSCLWTDTDIWGNLLKKEKKFLRPKWDRLMAILKSRRPRRHNRHKFINMERERLKKKANLAQRGGSIKFYHFLKPRKPANFVYDYKERGYRTLLAERFCLQRYYGDIKFRRFRQMCRPLSSFGLQKTLDTRIDILLYHLGCFKSIYTSRQAVLHGKILVNDKTVTHASYKLTKGDIISFCPAYRPIMCNKIISSGLQLNLKIKRIPKRMKKKVISNVVPTPSWIQTEYADLSFIIGKEANLVAFYPFRAKFDEVATTYQKKKDSF